MIPVYNPRSSRGREVDFRLLSPQDARKVMVSGTMLQCGHVATTLHVA